MPIFFFIPVATRDGRTRVEVGRERTDGRKTMIEKRVSPFILVITVAASVHDASAAATATITDLGT